jgi:hypothetical protein
MERQQTAQAAASPVINLWRREIALPHEFVEPFVGDTI